MVPDISPGATNSNATQLAFTTQTYPRGVAGNKRQKISLPEPAEQDRHDSEMQGRHRFTDLFYPAATNLPASHATCAHAEAALPVATAADSAADYSSWSVQQLMKLYYSMPMPYAWSSKQALLISAGSCFRSTISAPRHVQVAGVWKR